MDTPSDPEAAQQMEELRRVLLKPDILADRIAPLIADILAEEIAAAPGVYAQALTPAVLESLRRQVYESRETLVEALYPAIGPMINRAVTESFRGLARNVDGRVRGRKAAELRAHAADADLSDGEYRLRAALPFTVSEVFLIQRQSGILIAYVSDGDVRPDSDVVSGMLTAIRTFARDAFGRGDNGELGAIEYEDRRILLEAGGSAYIAAVIEGVEPIDFRARLTALLDTLQEQLYDRLLTFDGSDSELVSDVETRLRPLLIVEHGRPTAAPAPRRTAAPPAARGRLSSAQRAILGGLAICALLPLFGCAWWLTSVERRFANLSAQPAVVVLATFTPQPTTTATVPLRDWRGAGEMQGNVYLRDSPSLDGIRTPIIAPLGARVEILGEQNDWYQVRVLLTEQSGVTAVGWVLKLWIRPLGAT